MQTIQVSTETNAYALASQYLGDATQFWRILEASGMSDPFWDGLVTVVIPDVDPALTDGLPPTS